MTEPLAFLQALFADTEGFIEVRLIEDKKGGAVVGRCWYDSPAGLAQDLPRLLALAETKVAAIFFGVLPRRERGVGKSEDTLPALAIWIDLDAKDFDGGNEEYTSGEAIGGGSRAGMS